MEAWVAQETVAADMGDARLNQRLGIVLNRLGDNPSISIPAASKGWAEIQAAYRFFSNDKVTMEKILSAHEAATLERIKSQRVVLLVNDTTQLNYVVERNKEGLGTLTTQDSTRYHLHPTIALTPDRVCLGTVTAKFWQRPEQTEGHLRKQKEIKDKESIRWLESYEKACEISRQAPQSLIVSVGDRESDIYEYYQLHAESAAGQRAQWLVRAAWNRRVITARGNKSNLWETMARAPKRGTVSFEIPPTGNRKGRTVTQDIRSASVVFDGVQRKGRRLPPLRVNVVYAKERRVPKGEKPVEWMLLTSVAVDSIEQCQEVIGWYTCRWEIEIYFKVLKSGCGVQELQFEKPERLQPCLAVYMIIAWRVMFIEMLARSAPKMRCSVIFEEHEWKSVYAIVQGRKPPKKAPMLKPFVDMLASLGGYIGRKSDGPPGPKTIWIGLQRMHDFALAAQALNRFSICV
jgi:hypothetical protein